MGMAKKAATIEAPVTEAVVAAIPVTKVEAERVTKQEKKVVEHKALVKAVAYGRELSDYELQKDRKIGVAGVVQAVIGSDWYAQQAALIDLTDESAVKTLRTFAKEEAEFWLAVIREKSE